MFGLTWWALNCTFSGYPRWFGVRQWVGQWWKSPCFQAMWGFVGIRWKIQWLYSIPGSERQSQRQFWGPGEWKETHTSKMYLNSYLQWTCWLDVWSRRSPRNFTWAQQLREIPLKKPNHHHSFPTTKVKKQLSAIASQHPPFPSALHHFMSVQLARINPLSKTLQLKMKTLAQPPNPWGSYSARGSFLFLCSTSPRPGSHLQATPKPFASSGGAILCEVGGHFEGSTLSSGQQ